MNVENLARQAIDIIKSNWGLPQHGFITGGSIANIIWELVSGNKSVVNDIDVFIFDGEEVASEESLFKYQETQKEYFEDNYCGINYRLNKNNIYSIVESTKDGIFNNILYKSNSHDPFVIIRSFDINATQVGYDIDTNKFYWTKEFEEFLKTGELKITNLMTPSHTAIRLVKKSVELNAKYDEFELQLVQYVLDVRYSDVIKYRFMHRYYDMYHKYEHLLKEHFSIHRDEETEDYVKREFLKDTELYFLMNKEKKTEYRFLFISDLFSDDKNIHTISNTRDFLFYMRNIYGNIELKDIWGKLYYFYNNEEYIDQIVSPDDIDLLSRFAKNAPNSISNLKGYKLSEQIAIIKRFLENYKEDPIVAIAILENIKIDKNLELDEQTSLLLELSVRKHIFNDGKVDAIMNPESKKVVDEGIDNLIF